MRPTPAYVPPTLTPRPRVTSKRLRLAFVTLLLIAACGTGLWHLEMAWSDALSSRWDAAFRMPWSFPIVVLSCISWAVLAMPWGWPQRARLAGALLCVALPLGFLCWGFASHTAHHIATPLSVLIWLWIPLVVLTVFARCEVRSGWRWQTAAYVLFLCAPVIGFACSRLIHGASSGWANEPTAALLRGYPIPLLIIALGLPVLGALRRAERTTENAQASASSA